MNKIWLVIKREYFTRVRNKTFILSTFLTPLLFAGVIGIIIFITIRNTDKEKIAVIDNSGTFKVKSDSVKSIKFELNPKVDTSNFSKEGYSAILFSPQTGINKTTNWQLYSKKNFGVIAIDAVNDKISREIENDLMMARFQSGSSAVDSIKSVANNIKVEPNIIGQGSKVEKGNSAVAYGVGYGAGFLIYITLFIYGAMVMRGVMEEKTNRIAEVIISSVKPFQLMMGKIIGIGAVGLTQFLMWIILVTVFSSILTAFIPPELLSQVEEANKTMPGGAMGMQGSDAMIGLANATHTLSSVNWWLIVGCFIFYFIGGYLFYAALFAAVGSAVNEDPQDAQSLMFPITMPIILAIVIMINAITHPESSLATWSSIIPFFSPIVMMARIPFGVPGTVPYWQLGLSMALLIAGFLFTTWLSAKIYRTGILLYGKKATWKEMWKWAFRK
ncbi:MAG: ABC transporter permease [Gemmatimonadaceae bacterium]|nr:ABC transporter permease [Chitinophagaceae bacterium]